MRYVAIITTVILLATATRPPHTSAQSTRNLDANTTPGSQPPEKQQPKGKRSWKTPTGNVPPNRRDDHDEWHGDLYPIDADHGRRQGGYGNGPHGHGHGGYEQGSGNYGYGPDNYGYGQDGYGQGGYGQDHYGQGQGGDRHGRPPHGSRPPHSRPPHSRPPRPQPGWFPNNVSVLLDPYAYGGGINNIEAPVRSQATYHRQPFPKPNPEVVTLIRTGPTAAQFQSAAETALRGSHYAEALRWVNHALVEEPENGHLRLFQVHTLTGLQSYAAADAALHHATQFLAPHELGTFISRRDEFYAASQFDQVLDQLKSAQADAPESTTVLLAYHLTYLDRPSRREAKKLLQGLENDSVAEALQQQPVQADTPVESLPAPTAE
ncbi:MAG: hypothetical protein O3C60_12115 [Planctomycetota bacterium]|nr:hypothetical protein [Planctomycetota bacterium]